MSQKQVELVCTLFGEIAKYQRAISTGNVERKIADLFCAIQHPDGRLGSVPVGREGMEVLAELARSAIEAVGLSGRVSENTSRNILGPMLIQKFSIDEIPIGLTEVQRLIGKAGKKMRATLRSRVHLIPCHLIDANDPDEIILGPVRFLNRSAFRRMLLMSLPRRRDSEWDRLDRQMLARAIQHFRGYRWVAAVSVNDCDPELADRYAHNTATLGLSFLQLLFGASASQRMQIGGDKQGWASGAELKLTSDALLEVAVSHHFKGGANFEDGWSGELNEAGMEIGVRLCGLALEASLPGRKRPLSDRILGAVQWYGEAVREEAPATRIIKFMTAVEHLVLTDEREDITKTMAERVAALTYEIGSLASRQREESEFLRLYGIRSSLIHGRTSPWSGEISQSLGAAAELTERAIHSALNGWREAGLLSPDAGPKRMQFWYKEAVWQMVSETEPVAHITAWKSL